MDWNNVIDCKSLSYILGNPPFLGYSVQIKEQKEDLSFVCSECGKNIDYVVGWYYKAAKFIQNSIIRAAFVSTNSICQGEQVTGVWKPLMEHFKIKIDFAYRTFRWDNETTNQAHVHCIIVGFSCDSVQTNKVVYDGNNTIVGQNINAYLMMAEDIFIERRTKPICDVPIMQNGSSPVDGGYFLFTPEEYEQFIANEPLAIPYIKEFVGSEEFINGKHRYCLWLQDVSPTELRRLPLVMKRIEGVKQSRLSSKKEATRRFADMPTRFMESRQPQTDYLLIPRISSEKRLYIPIGYMSCDVITSDRNKTIADADLYHFAIITSIVHMAWMRTVCGRLKSDYNYSNDIVYNNFPWPTPTDEQKTKIETTAQAILDARALYPDSSLADLYDDLTMPIELRKAHKANDAAVMEAYGFRKDMKEPEIVAELFKMYQKLTCNKE